MKLVELLAREMTEWPEFTEGGNSLEQDFDKSVIEGHGCGTVGLFMLSQLASDFTDAHVTRAQWQAERDRQKGGEWKRHRGGVKPVPCGDRLVEVKLRCGDIQQAMADEFIWSHAGCDHAANIMQYRVISQLQAEEIDMVPTHMMLGYGSKEEMVAQIGEVDPFEQVISGMKTEYFDGPLSWRDTIIHCQAIIEDCEREIRLNEDRLALEGFALIPAMTPVAGVADVDMSDWRNWKAGDEVKMIADDWCDLTLGSTYTITEVGVDGFSITDDCGDHRSLSTDRETVFTDGSAPDFKWISRP